MKYDTICVNLHTVLGRCHKCTNIHMDENDAILNESVFKCVQESTIAAAIKAYFFLAAQFSLWLSAYDTTPVSGVSRRHNEVTHEVSIGKNVTSKYT